MFLVFVEPETKVDKIIMNWSIQKGGKLVYFGATTLQ